jgi:REP element-mobilizing transposase RayT
VKQSKTYYHRHLPHYQPHDATFHVMFRLAGSLPEEVIERMRVERIAQEENLAGITDRKKLRDEWTAHHAEYFEKFDALLDGASGGPLWLAEASVATIVAEAIRHRDGKSYDLLANCIMPNHVHMVIAAGRPDWSPNEDGVVGRRDSSTYRLTKILENLKWYTALKCNKGLHRRGAFWQHESYDHVIRDTEELERTIWYVLHNPVKAHLVETWEQWRWTYCKPGLL